MASGVADPWRRRVWSTGSVRARYTAPSRAPGYNETRQSYPRAWLLSVARSSKDPARRVWPSDGSGGGGEDSRRPGRPSSPPPLREPVERRSVGPGVPPWLCPWSLRPTPAPSRGGRPTGVRGDLEAATPLLTSLALTGPGLEAPSRHSRRGPGAEEASQCGHDAWRRSSIRRAIKQPQPQ